MLCLILLPSISVAQDVSGVPASEYFAQNFVQSLDTGSEADCMSRLSSRKLLYQNANAGDLDPLLLVVEGHRLICERLRIEAEIRRLGSEKSRLLAEVERLNALWNLSGSKEFPGRNRSQKIMLSDVRGIEKAEKRLWIVAEDLQQEAGRILRLSVDDIARHRPAEKEAMRVAIDAEAQRSIFDGFRDLLPKLG